MRSTLLLILILLGVLLSCENEKDELRKDAIRLGDYTGMEVIRYDTIFNGEYHHAQILDLDVNQNGTDDIRLVSEIWGSPGIGQHPASYVYCLHPKIGLFGNITNDTLYLNHEISYYTYDNNVTNIYDNYQYGCHRMGGNDTILSISHDVFKVNPQYRNQVIRTGDTFRSDSLSLRGNFSGSYPSYPEQVGADTFLITTNSYHNNCEYFPDSEVFYLGFKIEEGDEEKLGWVKMSGRENYILTLFESAIQE